MYTDSQAPNPAATIAERLNGGGPHIITFGGQATPWRQTLTGLVFLDHALAADVVAVNRAVAERLAPVSTDLLTVTPRGSGLLDGEATPVAPQHRTTADGADVSMPGILVAQHAVLASLPGAGIDPATHAPVSAIDHSQGVLGISLPQAAQAGKRERVIEVHVVARLIGATITRTTRRLDLGMVGESTLMLSARGVMRNMLDAVLSRVPGSERISVGVTNDRRAHILSGRPANLKAVVIVLEAAAARSANARKDHRRSGAVLAPVTEFPTTSVPFHTPLLVGAVDDVAAWAAACGLSEKFARELAIAVLIDPVDWPGLVTGALTAGSDAPVRTILDLGPGNVLVRPTGGAVAGTGITAVPAGTAKAIGDLDRAGAAPRPGVDRSRFAPRITRLPDGRLTLDTTFTRLTGRNAVLLAGMTPTTVDPAIVAAATNAGCWAELAGGSQTTPTVLIENLRGLEKALESGCTAAFNAMFMDRYLWNPYLGTQCLLSKTRAGGAPIDGITISAGIPELGETTALPERLHAEGFPYITFKPGIVGQIRQVLTIAHAMPDSPVII